MHPADSILWRIEEDPVLRSTVTAVSVLDRVPDWELLRERMIAASEKIPQMHEVVSENPMGLGAPKWVPAPHFDIDYHLRRVQLPQPATLSHALEFAAHQAMADFDRARPLWEFTLVEGIGDGAVLIQKFHHAVTDGVGGIRLALEIFDTDRDASLTSSHHSPLPTHTDAGVDPFEALRQAVVDSTETAEWVTREAAKLPGRVSGVLIRAGRSPVRSAAGVVDSMRWGVRLIAPARSPMSPVMTARSTRLGFAAFDVDLDRLRAAGRHAGGSLNDAFLTAVASGLERYHDAQGSSVSELRVTMPVNIRREGDDLGGNRFTPIRFAVPVHAGDPARTLHDIRRIVHEWRAGPALGLSDALATLLNGLPTHAVTRLFGSMLRNVDFVATNVPGLPVPVYLAGAEIVRQYAFAPPSGSALSVALLTHVGSCCIGVNMDREAVEDPELLVRSLEQGFAEVLGLAEPAKTASTRRRTTQRRDGAR